MFLVKLGHRLGRTVDELIDTISIDELRLQTAAYALDPWDEWRGDFRVAQLCAIFANVNRDPKKRPRPYQVSDFMPFEAAAKRRRQVQGDGVIEADTLGWLQKQTGVKLVDGEVDEFTRNLREAAPHLNEQQIRQIAARKHAN